MQPSSKGQKVFFKKGIGKWSWTFYQAALLLGWTHDAPGNCCPPAMGWFGCRDGEGSDVARPASAIKTGCFDAALHTELSFWINIQSRRIFPTALMRFSS